MTEQQKRAAADQKVKLNELVALYEAGEKELTVAGKAGTGKTQLAIELIQRIAELMSDDRSCHIGNIKVGGAAISHGAKTVLGDRIKLAKIEKIFPKFFTIAALLKLKRTITKTGEILFLPDHKQKKTGNKEIVYPPIKQLDLLIIDECSQISKDTKKMIDEEKGLNTVIIYLGDWHQTPPISKDREVGEDSPTFKLPGIKLNIPFRYEGDIELLASAIADEIDKPNNHNFKFLMDFVKDKDKDYSFSRNPEAFYQQFIDDYNTSTELKHAVLINYRKNTTKYLANKVRNILVDTKRKYVEGEVIVCKRGPKEDLENTITTHKVFRIQKVKESNALVSTKYGYFKKIMLEDAFSEFMMQQDGESIATIPVYLLDLVDEYGKVHFNVVVLQNEKDPTYFKYRTNLKNKASRSLQVRDWISYFGFYEFFCEFGYAYSVNTYIVQGATYNNVYVNLRDIITITPIDNKEKLQSLYTSVTRARSKVTILV